MAQAKKKKPSIREFVNEDGLKFQLYLLKYSNQLKHISEKTTEEIEEKWAYDTQKKINRFKNDALKSQFSGEIPQAAIKFNIEYASLLPAPICADKVHEAFEKRRVLYLEALEKRIQDNATATLENDKMLLEYAKVVQLTKKVSKEKFGQMLLLMIKNLATMPSFSGYSDNWKTDFFSNAIEKTLLYLDNFDEELLSKRTGNKSNAFAYVTQICFNAFVNIINIRKKEDAFLKVTISLESANLDGIRHYANNGPDVHVSGIPDVISTEYKVSIKKIDELQDAIKNGLEHIELSNEIIDTNKANASEIKYIEESTPQIEKTEDYEAYIMDLKSKIIPELEKFEITTLKIIKPKDTPLGDFELPSQEELKGIQLIIAEKPKRKLKPKVEEVQELVEIDEVEEFDKEW